MQACMRACVYRPVISVHTDQALPSPHADPDAIHKLPHRDYCIRRPYTWHETNEFVSDSCFVPKPSSNDPFPNIHSV